MGWDFLRRRRRVAAPSVSEDVSGLYRRTSEGGPHCTAIRFHGRVDEKEQGKEVAGKEQGKEMGAGKEQGKEVGVAQEAQEGPRRRNTAGGGSLAWDTFRRLRRHASQVVRNSTEGPEEEVARRGRRGEGERRRPVSSLPALPPRRGEQYQSTPLLFHLGQHAEPGTPSVVKYTNWEKNNSLITLNFNEEQEEEEEKEQERRGERLRTATRRDFESENPDHSKPVSQPVNNSRQYCDTDSVTRPVYELEHNMSQPVYESGQYCDSDSVTQPVYESGQYCDSDSGISSMYESINRGGRGVLAGLDTRHLASSLVSVLARSPRLSYSSRVLDLSFQLPCTVGREEEEGGLWGRTDLLHLLHRQGEHLGQALGVVTEQLAGVGESLQEVEEQLGRAGADYREVRRWRQCVCRVEPLASLLFGLELRLEEGVMEAREAVEGRLKEAEELGRRQEQEVLAAEGLVGKFLGVTARLSFRRIVQQRKSLVCEQRALEREVRAVQARKKIVNLCADL